MGNDMSYGRSGVYNTLQHKKTKTISEEKEEDHISFFYNQNNNNTLITKEFVHQTEIQDAQYKSVHDDDYAIEIGYIKKGIIELLNRCKTIQSEDAKKTPSSSSLEAQIIEHGENMLRI